MSSVESFWVNYNIQFLIMNRSNKFHQLRWFTNVKLFPIHYIFVFQLLTLLCDHSWPCFLGTFHIYPEQDKFYYLLTDNFVVLYFLSGKVITNESVLCTPICSHDTIHKFIWNSLISFTKIHVAFFVLM